MQKRRWFVGVALLSLGIGTVSGAQLEVSVQDDSQEMFITQNAFADTQGVSVASDRGEPDHHFAQLAALSLRLEESGMKLHYERTESVASEPLEEGQREGMSEQEFKTTEQWKAAMEALECLYGYAHEA